MTIVSVAAGGSGGGDTRVWLVRRKGRMDYCDDSTIAKAMPSIATQRRASASGLVVIAVAIEVGIARHVRVDVGCAPCAARRAPCV